MSSEAAAAREKVLDALRAFATHDFSRYPEDGHHPRIDRIVADAGTDVVEAASAVWVLVAEGVIVPGAGFALVSAGQNDSFKSFPYFSITARGREVLGAR